METFLFLFGVAKVSGTSHSLEVSLTGVYRFLYCFVKVLMSRNVGQVVLFLFSRFWR